jgi:hypothetical protein
MIAGEDLELFARSVRSATEQHSGDALDDAITELGWGDALGFDTHAAVSTLFELQGEACSHSSALDRVVAFALGVELAPDSAVVAPPVGRTDAPAVGDDERVSVHGLALSARASYLVVSSMGAVTVDAGALVSRVVGGIDPDLGLLEVQGEVTLSAEAPVDWGAGVRLAQLALGHELVGVSRRALTLARVHALERIQFDQPIARFQAVRHRLAETLVAIETAAAVLDAAWLDPTPVAAAMAKATAGRSARVAAKHCQQVLAGIGFTTEHDLHRHLRRIWALDQLFGSSAVLTKQLGQDLLARRELPPLLPL